MPKVKDLTNATCRRWHSTPPYDCQGAVGAIPSASGNGYQRLIGAGFFTEWGRVSDYTGATFYDTPYYWTSPENGNDQFVVSAYRGSITRPGVFSSHVEGHIGLCVYP